MSDDEAGRVIVIGGGPGGYAAAFRAADRGLSVTVVDEGDGLGGVCVDRGCIPSKALLTIMETILRAREASEAGVHFDDPSIDLDALRTWKDEIVDRLVGGLDSLAERRDIEHVHGRARFVDTDTVEIDGDERRSFDHVVLATGSRPRPLPGVEFGERIMDSARALALPDLPGSLLVVGGGYVGLELGQVYATLGSEVTVVEMTDSLLPGTDEDLVGPLSDAVAAMVHDVRLGTRVEELTEADGAVEARIDDETLTFDRALVAIGRVPNVEDLGLDAAGIETRDDGTVDVDEHRRTSNPRVLALGDVAGGAWLAHEAMREGEVAADVIAGEADAFDARAIPAVVYTDPQVAWCGLTEAEAERQEREVKVERFPWSASGRAHTLGASAGFTKLLFDPDDGRLLGAGIVGRQAEALVAEAVVAIEMGAVARDLEMSIHPHPTLSETIGEAAASFHGVATHVAH
ncbi:MAG TPA: dihydrolipoyl dehydrogenase [Candidatus Krumholzibacteria bacterium]|nr:dihydrolipoyl dehydrogenase [Candidatus Krumholzibacteria bacterium]